MIETFLRDLDLPSGTTARDRIARILGAFRRIPYENLSKIIAFDARRADAYDAEELLRGFYRSGSGGTCFSIVNALGQVMQAAGIRTSIRLADRRSGDDSHCLLIAEDRWILDPGYLVFEPVDFPEGSVPAPGGRLCWTARGDRILAETVFPNGHRKLRYTLKPAPVGRDDFVGAWKRTFDFEMMRSSVLTRIAEDGRHHYLRDGHYMIDGRTVRRLGAAEIPGAAAEFGVAPEVAERAMRILGRT
jgi:arylamine N-acetyltransferase